jgi:hypothetical protein
MSPGSRHLDNHTLQRRKKSLRHSRRASFEYLWSEFILRFNFIKSKTKSRTQRTE